MQFFATPVFALVRRASQILRRRVRRPALPVAQIRPAAKCLAACCAILAAGPLFAATETWSTGAGDGTGKWSVAGNWTGTNLPPISGDFLIFGATTGTITLNDDLTSSSFNIAGITFNAGDPAYAISGNTFNLTGGITDNATNTQTVNDAFSMTAAQTFTVSSGGTLLLGGVISGAGGITANGAGTLTLSAANTYTGGTTVNSGTVNVSGDQSAATGGWLIQPAVNNTPATTVNFQTGSTVVVAAGNSITINYPSTFGNAFPLSLNAAGTVTNSGSLILQRQANLNLNNGAAWTQNGGMAIDPAPNAATSAGPNMTVNTGSTFTYSGASAITINPSNGGNGSGTLNIAGGTFVTGQPFAETLASNTGAGKAVINLGAAGTLRLSANVTTLTSAGLKSLFTFTIGAGGGTIDTQTFSSTMSNIVGGTGALTKAGSGTLTLSGANTYSGGTTLNSGTLVLGSSSTGSITNGPIGTGALTLNGGTLTVLAGATRSIANNILATASTTTSLVPAGNDLQLNGNITGSGTLTDNATSNGLYLGGNNSGFTGTYNGAARNTFFTNATAGSASATWTISSGNNFLASAISGPATISFGALSGAGGLETNAGSSGAITYSIGALGTNTTLSGVIQNTDPGNDSATVAITKTGSGALTLSGTNTYTGITTINSGVVSIAADAGLGANPDSFTANQLTLNGGTLKATGSFSTAGNRGVTIGSSGGTFDVTGVGFNITTAVAGSGTLTTGGAGGAFTLSATNSGFTGNIVVNSGYFGVNGDAAFGAVPSSFVANAITLNGGSLMNMTQATSGTGFSAGFDLPINANRGITLGPGGGTIRDGYGRLITINSVISGSGALTIFTDGGTVMLTAANTFTGNTSNGTGTTLDLANSLALEDSTLASGGQLLTFDSSVSSHAFTLGGLSGGNALSLSDTASNPVALTVGNNNSSNTYSGVLSGGGSLTQVGTGTLTLSGANSYSGGTAIQSGTIRLGANNTLPTAGTVTFGGASTSGTLDLNAVSQQVGGLALGAGASWTGQTITNNATGTGTLVYNGGTSTFGGVIQDGGTGRVAALTVSGGTLTLSGANTYTGATLVSAGTLNLTGSLTGSNVTVNGASAALNESSAGVIGGSGSTFTLTTGTATLAGANTFTGATAVNGGSLYVNGSLSASSAVAVAGGATLGGSGSVGNATVAGGGNVATAQTGSGSLSLTGLSFSGEGTVNVTLPLVNYTSTAAIIDSGALLANGAANSVTINLPAAALVSNTYKLISYTGSSIGGTGFSAFTLGTQPALGARQALQLQNNNNGTSGEIDLVITGFYPIWTGGFSSEWSTNTISSPKNWKSSSDGTPIDFITGDTVHFDNTAANQVVDINQANVNPTSASFDSGSYTLQSTPGLYGIAGNAALAVNGGVLLINNANTYTGTTSINGGTLRVGNANAIPSDAGTGNVVLNGGATAGVLDLNGQAMVNINGLQGATGATLGQVLNSGSGVATLNLGLGDASAAFAGIIKDNNGGSGQIAIVKNGAGVETLSGPNTYTGGTTIAAGTLQVGANNTLPIGGMVAFGDASHSGTLDLNAFSQQVGGLALGAGASWTGQTITNNAMGTGTLVYNGGTSSFGGVVQGGGTGRVTALTVSGGSLTIGGGPTGVSVNNTYSGPTTINAGGTLVAYTNSGGTGGYDFATIPAASTISLGGGTLEFDVEGNADPWFKGTITGSGTTWITGAAGRYFNIGGATGFANRLSANSDLQLDIGLNLFGNAQTIGALNGAGTINNNSVGNVTLTVGANGNAGMFSGVITDDGTHTVSLAKSGAGVQILSGANTYAGTTTINAGTLRVSGAANVLPIAGSVVTAGGTFDLNGQNQQIAMLTGTSGTLTNSAAADSTLTLQIAANSAGTFAGVITTPSTGTLNLIMNSTAAGSTASNFALDNTGNTFTGSITVNGNGFTDGNDSHGGILGIDLDGSLGDTSNGVTLNNGGVLANMWNPSGAGGWPNHAAYTLASTRTITMGTGVGGVIRVGYGDTVTINSLITGPGALTTDDSGVIVLGNSGNNWQGGTTINGAQIRLAADNAVPATGNVTDNGALDLNSHSLLLAGLTGSGTVLNSGSGTSVLTVGNSDASSNFSGIINDNAGTAGVVALTKTGAGTLTLSGANTYTGGTSIAGGTVNINADTALGASGAVTFTGNATLQAGAANIALAGAHTITLNPSVTGTIDTQANSMSIAGAIGGNGVLAKAGAGTLTLNGANSYSGGTMITGGTLVAAAANTIGSGPVTLSNGTTLRVAANLLANFGNNGTGWTLNGGPTVASDVLTLTTNAGSQARSAFYNSLQAFVSGNNGFTTTFTYTPSGNKAADGMAFILQNDSRGAAALGAPGGAFGYGGTAAITPSAALEINIYNNTPTFGIGTNFVTNGATNSYNSASPVGLASGDPIQVTLTYIPASSTVTETLTDSVASTTYSTTYTGVNLSAMLGGSTAYIGFSGGTGALVATQTISNFSYSLASANAYSNSLILSAGSTSTVDVGATAAASGVAMGGLTVNGGGAATFNVTASTAPTNAAYSLTLGTVSLNSGLTLNVANNGSGTGTLSLGAINDGGTPRTVNLTGAGTVALAAPATTVTAGTTFNVAAGTLRSTDPGALGAIATVNVAAGATFSLGATQQIGSLGDSGTVVVNGASVLLNGNTLTIGNATNNLNSTFSGVISDGSASGSIITAGSGTLTLAGANAYTGTTTVGAGGALRVTGSIASAAMTTVGGTLTGTGTVSGPVTVSSGGQISGASSASLTLGSLGLSTGSKSSFALTTAGVNNSTALVAVNGGLTGPGMMAGHAINLTGYAALGTYDLYSFSGAAPNLSDFTIGSYPNPNNGMYAYSLALNTMTSPEQLDLLVGLPNGSSSWNVNFNGAWSNTANWSPNVFPNAAMQTATFGNGVSGPNQPITPPPAAITISVDGAETVGGLYFTNTNGTQYILSGSSGNGITLDNTGGLGPATVSVASGVTAQQVISAPLTFNDNVTFNVASGTSLLISLASIGETGGPRNLTLTGGGTLSLDATPVNYTGTTKISNGTLRVSASSNISTNAVLLDATGGNVSKLVIGNSQTVNNLATANDSGTGSATLEVQSGGSMTVSPTAAGTSMFQGKVQLDSSGGVGATLAKAGDNGSTLVLNGPTTFQENSSLQVYNGTLQINASGTTSVATGVTATVALGATLELDGTTSALTDSTNSLQRASIQNDGSLVVGAATAPTVGGTVQQVGGIDGISTPGSVVVSDGASLTADHINQTSLVIGNGSVFTLAPSNADGSPMAGQGSGSSLLLAGSLTPSSSFVATSGSLLSGSPASATQSVSLGSVSGESANAVPESSSILLLGFGSLALGAIAMRKRRVK